MKRRKGRAALLVATLLCIGVALTAKQAPPSQRAKQEVPSNPLHSAPPAQPVPYSHKTHLALGLQCQFCHGNPDPGEKMGFPPTSKCMGCHATIAKGKPAIRKLAQLAKTQQPIPWTRVYTLLAGVRWTHRQHVDARVKCETCHGPVAQMDTMAEVTSVTTMGGCINCHDMHKAKSACVTCHAWPTAEATR